MEMLFHFHAQTPSSGPHFNIHSLNVGLNCQIVHNCNIIYTDSTTTNLPGLTEVFKTYKTYKV